MLQLLYIPLYALYVAAFLLFIFDGKFFDIDGIEKKHLAIFFLLKVAGGLALTLVYTWYYTDPTKADIYRYFTDSRIISSLLFTHPMAWFKVICSVKAMDAETLKYLHDTLYISHPVTDPITSNTLLIKVISLLNYFSFYSIYIDTLLLNCITFAALIVLLKVLVPYFETFPQILYWPLFLLPSVVFWSSGLLKEALLFIGISLYLAQWLQVKNDRPQQKLIISALGFLIVGITKVYVALVLFACTVLLPYRNAGAFKWVLTTRIVVGFVMCLACWYYFSNYPVCRMIAEKRNEFIALSITVHSNSALDTNMIVPDCGHLIKLIPVAITNAVLRPFIWEKGNLLQMLFAAENLTFIIAIICLMAFYFKLARGHKAWLALFCFLFAALNYLGIGITVPIMGAIVHYRVIALPFLLLSVLLMTDLNKLKLHTAHLYSYLNYKR